MASSYNELFGLGSHSEDADLEGWWPLQDDAASTAVDDASSNGRDGTLTGGNNTADIATTGPNSWLQSALALDGSADYIDVGTLGTLGSTFDTAGITILVRLKTSDTAETLQRIAGLSNPGSPDSTILTLSMSRTNGGDIDIFARDSGGGATRRWITTAAGGHRDGTWKAIAACLATTIGSSYIRVNGSSQSLTNQDFDSISTGNFERNFLIGASNGVSPTINLTADYAEFAIFGRTLTTAEADEWLLGPEPINSVAPVVSGTETVGQTLSCTTGTWGLDAPFSSGSNGTISCSYQWTRSDDNTGTNEADIGSATSSTYTLQAADEAKSIRCRVRATNDGGFDAAADASSNFTGEIQADAGGVSIPILAYHYNHHLGSMA